MIQRNKVCLNCKHLFIQDNLYWCNAKYWPIPFAEERSMLGNRPCWCPLNKEK